MLICQVSPSFKTGAGACSYAKTHDAVKDKAINSDQDRNRCFMANLLGNPKAKYLLWQFEITLWPPCQSSPDENNLPRDIFSPAIRYISKARGDQGDRAQRLSLH